MKKYRNCVTGMPKNGWSSAFTVAPVLEKRITIIDLEFETMFELLENSCIDHDLDMSIATD